MVSPVDDPDAHPAGPAPRRRRDGLRPLALGLVGALVGVGVYAVVIDSPDGSAPRRAASTGSTPTTTVPVPEGVQVYETLLPSLVLVRTQAGSGGIGSGVVVNDEGHVLTAHHVLNGATEVEVAFADGTRSTAVVVSADPAKDLALLAPAALPEIVVPAVLGGGVRIGDAVYPLGNPFGFTGTLTAGVVSGLGRTLLREDGEGEIGELIQFDAAVNPGSSGGPLVDAAGQVVGIVTALANPTDQRTFVGLGFAVPITTAGGVTGAIDR